VPFSFRHTSLGIDNQWLLLRPVSTIFHMGLAHGGPVRTSAARLLKAADHINIYGMELSLSLTIQSLVHGRVRHSVHGLQALHEISLVEEPLELVLKL